MMEIRKLFGSTTNISGAISSETPQLNGQYVEAEMDLKPNILSFGISVNL